MFVLPRMTAPARAQALRDVGVVRRDVALEDPRPSRALAALDRNKVLERDRDPEQRVERVERGRSVRAGRREPGIGRVGLGEGGRMVDRQPGVEAGVLSVGEVEMGLRQLARRQLADAQAGRHVVRVKARQLQGHDRRAPQSPPRIAGTTMKSPSRAAAFDEHSLDRQR